MTVTRHQLNHVLPNRRRVRAVDIGSLV